MKHKILVIEDKNVWKRILQNLLEDNGYEVDVVDSLDLALHKMNEENYHFITIDMLLNDTGEPIDYNKLEGWPILNFIKKADLRHKTPIMIITQFADEDEVTKRLRATKFVFVMHKTNFDEKVFLDAVARYIKQANVTFSDRNSSQKP